MAPTLALRQFCGMPELEGMVSYWEASREHKGPVELEPHRPRSPTETTKIAAMFMSHCT